MSGTVQVSVKGVSQRTSVMLSFVQQGAMQTIRASRPLTCNLIRMNEASTFGLIVLEAALLTMAGLVLGYLLLTGVIFLANPVLADNFGLRLGSGLPSVYEIVLSLVLLGCGVLASLVPAIRVYRMTVTDGLTLRI